MKSQLSHELSEQERVTRCFLADAQHQLTIQCCRALAQLTTCTGKFFLTVARRGRSPPRTSSQDNTTDDNTNNNNITISNNSKRDEFSMHEEAYRSVRSAIAASCTLGHRSCHALWGPRGCGEHRILRLVAQDCLGREATLVIYLDGDTLNGDEEALRAIAQQILQFLKSPQSEKLRALDWSLRTGNFDFGNLFGFSKLMKKNNDDNDNKDADDNNKSNNDNDKDKYSSLKGRNLTSNIQTRRKKAFQEESEEKINRKRDRLQSADESQSDNDENSDEGEEPLLVTSTTAYISGGASSALPALQRCLLLMKSYGTNIVVCIRRVERFGVWCDQLLYVLSGLMHESDGRGGGMSLVMTSSTPDIRQLEKRLSSRLTCETRCIPLLPWSATRVVRACLVEIRDYLEKKISLQSVPIKKETKRKKISDETRLAYEIDYVIHPFTGWHFDIHTASEKEGEEKNKDQNLRFKEKKEIQKSTTQVSSNEIQLFEEIIFEMTKTIISELDNSNLSKQDSLNDNVFSSRITQISQYLRSIGATAGKVLIAVSNIFAETCSGRLEFIKSENRAKLISWLTEYLKKEEKGKPSKIFNLSSKTFDTAPDALKMIWLTTPSINTFKGKKTSLTKKTTTTIITTTTTPSTSTLLFSGNQFLFDDILSDLRLVESGYCSRETILILVYVYLRHEAGVSRTVVDLLEDVASSMGTQAAAALDRAAFRAAISSLHRWRIIRIAGRDGVGIVSLRGSPARLREFLQAVLHRPDYCSSVLGLEAKEITRLRSLI